MALRAPVRRLVGLTTAALVLSGGALVASNPAVAAETCYDGITATTRTATMVGGPGFDGFVGGHDAVISTLGGDDAVIASSGVMRLTVCLGDGHDRFMYSLTSLPPSTASSYSVRGGDGSDMIQGGNGNDVLSGDADHDVVLGEGGNDTIVGGNGMNDLHGGPGDDWISSALGASYLSGGDGNDTIISADDSSVVDGGPGVDKCTGRGRFINCEQVQR